MQEQWVPFVRRDPKPDFIEYLKMIILGLTLLPLRWMILSLLFLWYYLVVRIGLLGVDLDKPIPKFRKWFFIIAPQPIARVFFWFLGFYQFKMTGDNRLEDERGRANIIIMNHVSYLDIFLGMAITNTITGFVAKKEVLQVPIISFLSRVWGSLYVDRGKKEGKGSISSLIDERGKNFDQNPILIFPEGTTTNGHYIIPFHLGAFIGGHPIKPIAVRYPYKKFSPSWETISFTSHVFRLLTQLQNNVEIIFLPIYYPSEDEKKDPKLYAKNMQELISQTLKIPVYYSTFKDKQDYHSYLRSHPKSEPSPTPTPVQK